MIPARDRTRRIPQPGNPPASGRASHAAGGPGANSRPGGTGCPDPAVAGRVEVAGLRMGLPVVVRVTGTWRRSRVAGRSPPRSSVPTEETSAQTAEQKARVKRESASRDSRQSSRPPSRAGLAPAASRLSRPGWTASPSGPAAHRPAARALVTRTELRATAESCTAREFSPWTAQPYRRGAWEESLHQDGTRPRARPTRGRTRGRRRPLSTEVVAGPIA